MARKVFYSFHYENDITRVMTVRNRWVTLGGQLSSGVIDSADFEKVQKSGEEAIRSWIKKQLEGTSVTIVLIGSETLKRKYVQYEICESIKRGNAIIGIYINNIKDLEGKTSTACNKHTIIGKYQNGNPAYFDLISYGLYDYSKDDGYKNLDKWVENAVKDKERGGK